jgi:hypothetical protein
MPAALFKPPFPRLQRGRPPARGLVQAWPLYETSGQVVHDLGPYRQNGTTWSGAPKWAGDADGACLRMQNTTDYIEFGAGPTALAGSTAATFSFWIRYDAIPPLDNRIMGQWGPNGGNTGAVQSWLIGNGLNAATEVFLALQRNSAYVEASSNGANLAAGVRYHVCIIWQGANTVSFYINGVVVPTSYSVASFPSGGAILASTYPVYIGQEAASPANGFTGRISDVRFYSRALFAQEVREIFMGQA